MPILRVQHAVPNFDGWKRAFDSDPIDRLARSNPARVLPPDAPDVQLDTCKDVSDLLSETISQVRRGELDSRAANTIEYLSGILLKAWSRDCWKNSSSRSSLRSGWTRLRRRTAPRMIKILKRIERAEAATSKNGRSRDPHDCICFPENERPFFLYEEVEALEMPSAWGAIFPGSAPVHLRLASGGRCRIWMAEPERAVSPSMECQFPRRIRRSKSRAEPGCSLGARPAN
jgi:hypothetical protein